MVGFCLGKTIRLLTVALEITSHPQKRSSADSNQRLDEAFRLVPTGRIAYPLSDSVPCLPPCPNETSRLLHAIMLFACSRALRVATPSRAVVLMPRTMVTMSGTSREHEKRLLRGVMVEALEAQQRKRAGLEEQLERAEAAPLLNSDDEKAAKAHAKALRRAAQVPVRLSEVDAAETKLAELQAKLRSGGDVAEVCGRPHRVSHAHAKV